MNWKAIYKITFLLWLVFITVLSVIPSPDTAVKVSDKLIHFIAYFITTSLCYFAFRRNGVSFLGLAGIIVFLYGTAIEVVQSFLPYRDFSLGDVAANSSGIIFFIILWMMYSKLLQVSRG